MNNRSRSPARSWIDNIYRDRSESRSPDRSRFPRRRSPDSRSISRDRSRSRSRSGSQSPRDGSQSPRDRSLSPRAGSPGNRRSIIERDRYMRNKFGLYNHQQEYIFPIGIHDDIDQSIIEKMDFVAIINLLQINKTAKLRILIIKNIGNIIENSKDYTEYDLIDSYSNLLKLRELDILRSFTIPDQSIDEFNREIDINIRDNKQEIIDYLSILNVDQTVKFTNYILPMMDNDFVNSYYDIKHANKILKFALELENDIMIDTIKDWFSERNLIKITKQLKEMEHNLGL